MSVYLLFLTVCHLILPVHVKEPRRLPLPGLFGADLYQCHQPTRTATGLPAGAYCCSAISHRVPYQGRRCLLAVHVGSHSYSLIIPSVRGARCNRYGGRYHVGRGSDWVLCELTIEECTYKFILLCCVIIIIFCHTTHQCGRTGRCWLHLNASP